MRRLSLSRNWGFLVCAGVPLAISGCAWIPPGGERAEFLEPPPIDRTLATLGRRASHDSLDAWPGDHWWRRFRSPSLDGIIDAALNDSQGLAKAHDRLRAADAAAKVEGARLLPWLDSDAGMKQLRYAEHGTVASYNPALAGAEKTSSVLNPLALRYELDFWGKNRAALEAALGDAAAQYAELAEVRLVLVAAIARAYIRAASLARQLDRATGMVALRRELVQQAQSRVRSGLDNAEAVERARADLETANKREAATHSLLVIQKNLIARLMARGPDATVSLFAGKVPAYPEPFPLPAKLPIELLAHRPDLAAAMHRAEAAARRIHVTKAQFLPSIDLTAVAGLEASVFTKNASNLLGLLFSGGALNYTIAPGLHLPLFEGGRLRGQLEARRAEYDEAVDLYNDTLLDAARQVADGISSIKHTKSIVDSQHRLVDAKRTELKLAKGRMRDGLNDRREILSLDHALAEQQFVSEALEADHLVALVDLIQALGGGYATGIDLPRPYIGAEDSMSGLESLTPVFGSEGVVPTVSPVPQHETAEIRP